MAKTVDWRETYDCGLIGRAVAIDGRTFFAHGGLPLSPVAAARTPQRCSGMPSCQLFPSGKFPALIQALSSPTGCPYMASLTITGR